VFIAPSPGAEPIPTRHAFYLPNSPLETAKPRDRLHRRPDDGEQQLDGQRRRDVDGVDPSHPALDESMSEGRLSGEDF
jgi:hypothetical protein